MMVMKIILKFDIIIIQVLNYMCLDLDNKNNDIHPIKILCFYSAHLG